MEQQRPDLNDIAVFGNVAETGSFTAAARAMGMPRATVSRVVARLEGVIGAQLLYPDRRVLAACGDGGFLMSAQELETAVRAGARFVVLIFEDSGYGVIKWNQLRRYGRAAFVDFGNPNFVRLAESFGCRGYKVNAAGELSPILEEAFRQTVPAVVACPVDYSENLRLTEKLGAWVCP
jgi:acetolactate synthase I/II/III large subunit